MTETFQYLERTSSHPKSVFKGLVKGEIIRHIRNTSNQREAGELIEAFKIRLQKRGYKLSEINEIIQQTAHLNRIDLLKDKKVIKRKATVMVTKFNPAIKQLKRILLKHWHILKQNKRCSEIFKSEPIIAYSRNKNLQELLTKRVRH